jgi:hypothetical protein
MEDKGLTPDFSHSALTGQRQLHFHGLPVLVGRVPEPAVAGRPTTEAWAMRLFGPSGVRILHYGGLSDEFGIRTEPFTTATGLDANGEAISSTRGVEVFAVYSVLVPEPTSIARLRGIPSRDPFIDP